MSDEIKTFLEMLESGEKTRDEILNDVMDQLDMAENEIKRKKEAAAAQEKEEQESKKRALEDARVDFLDALIYYFIKLGILDEEPDDEEFDECLNILKTLEPYIKKYVPMLFDISNADDPDSLDEFIIKSYIKHLFE